jgi:hypothetical protein
LKASLAKRLTIWISLFYLLTVMGVLVCVAERTRNRLHVISDSSHSPRSPATQAEKDALLDELPRPAAFDASPSAIGHYGSSKTTS